MRFPGCLLFAVCLIFAASTANAQSYYYAQPITATQTTQSYYQSYSAVQYQPSSGGAFLQWLNGVRASAGLQPVAYDPAMERDASVNNTYQASRGLGHFYMGGARRQNAAMGAGNYAQIGAMWLASPGHRAALLDPTITRIGVAGAGMWWTFSAR
jgi:uncharacterized protein YkwD